MIPDILQIKTIQRLIGRQLTELERSGFKSIKVEGKLIRINQVSIQWLHNKNSCK